jgi:OmpA-OmpF porin, OOP family
MKSKIVFLFSVLAFGVSSGVAAQDRGFYAGLGLGKAKANLNRDDFTFGFQNESSNEVNTVYKFFGGYQLIKYLAVELSYTDFGKFTYQYETPVFFGRTFKGKMDYKATSWALSGVGSLPLGKGFSALGRLGVVLNTAERSAFTGEFAVVPEPPAATKRRASLLWGIGGLYEFTPALALRLEYEDYGKFGEAQSGFFDKAGRATIHMYSVGLIARF